MQLGHWGKIAFMKKHWVFLAVALAASSVSAAAQTSSTDDTTRLVTGKRLTPQGQQTDVGSFPANLVLSPDGNYVLVTNTGFREYLSVLRASDGPVPRAALDAVWAEPVQRDRALGALIVDGLIDPLPDGRFALPGHTPRL